MNILLVAILFLNVKYLFLEGRLILGPELDHKMVLFLDNYILNVSGFVGLKLARKSVKHSIPPLSIVEDTARRAIFTPIQSVSLQ